MRIRKIALLAMLALAVAIPGVSLAKKNDKYGIGKGGMPALRDQIFALIDGLQDEINGALRRVRHLEKSVAALENQFVDEDGDGSYQLLPDCDDADPNVSPLLSEIPSNGIDDDCDQLIDEAA